MVARRLVAPLAGRAEQAAASLPSISAACPSPAEKSSHPRSCLRHIIVPPVHDCLELWSLGLYYYIRRQDNAPSKAFWQMQPGQIFTRASI